MQAERMVGIVFTRIGKRKKDEKKAELNFNKAILYSNKLQVNTVVNTLTRYFTECIEKFKSKQYGISIEDVNAKQIICCLQ